MERPEAASHVAAPPPSPRSGSVRTLGWENLELSLDALSPGISNALQRLSVPTEVASWAGPMPTCFVVQPVKPSAPVDTSDAFMMPRSPDLRVCIQIFAAEAENF